MNAFVLSGGANLGSVQAGMLVGLLESGIRPDLVVGTSIGAANAAYIAADPSPGRAHDLCRVWRGLRSKDVFPIHPLRALRSVARGGAFFSPDSFWGLIQRELGYGRIEDAAIPLRIVATRFSDGSEVVFEDGSVKDAILASTALPLVFPPHEIDGELYLDGGLSDQVPLQPAVAAGALRIYVLSVGFPCPPPADHRSPRAVLMHSIGILLSQRIRAHSADLFARPGVEIVQVPPVCTEVALRDFSKSSTLIDQAREQTLRFLDGEPCHTCDHSHPTGKKGETHGHVELPSLRPEVPVRQRAS
ncbi:MAG TPA: patatin-like phospholipase family protein [Actinomycetota bacterium]|nr:patatin-like phospholipase family protein [Actinomycetota bacterium]